MKRSMMSVTLTDVLVVMVIVVILIPIVLSACGIGRAREEAHKTACKANCAQVGKAIATYTQNFDEFFPFTWAPADFDPKGSYASEELHSGARAVRPKDAMTSLGLLYPDYLCTAKVFKCPSTEHRPHLTVHWPTALWDAGAETPDAVREPAHDERYKFAWDQRNWQLHDSSYGYDCRIYPSAVANHAIYGDMDGTCEVNPETSTQNHQGGNHILYVDCHVKFPSTNICSNNRHDNVYVEDAWNADTDSYISDNTDPARPMNHVPNVFGLSGSYDDYDSLKP